MSTPLWISNTDNSKTGDIPTLFIGATRQESRESCKGCPLLEYEYTVKEGDTISKIAFSNQTSTQTIRKYNPHIVKGEPLKVGTVLTLPGNCYAQHGTPAMAHSSMVKAYKKGKDYSLRTALNDRSVHAKSVRFAAIGDPASLGVAYIKKAVGFVKEQGLDALGYTHFWKQHPELAGLLMASCDSLEDVDTALSMGFRATVVLPWDHGSADFETPGGARGVVCPAMTKGLTCNECRICDGSKKGVVIGFPDHGPKSNKKQRDAGLRKAKRQTKKTLSHIDI